VSDPVLVGSVLAQRYLSGAYRVQPQELKAWMARYADLPDAEEVFDLANQRFHRQAAGMKPPAHVDQAVGSSISRDEDATWEDFSVEMNRDLAPPDRRRVQEIKDRFRAAVRAGKYEEAAASFERADVQRVFDKVDYDELKTVLALALFNEGRDAEALRWAGDAAERSGDILPESHWVAGLALWRSGKRSESARHFEAVANAADASPWLTSAGAYWAARANLAARRPEVVNHWLQQAAGYPRSFYGLLARRALGQEVQFSWEARPFTDMDAEAISHIPSGRRALAFLQLGDRTNAEDELDHLSRSAGPGLAQSMLALAYAGGMPSLAVSLGGMVASQDGRNHDSAVYPVPEWRPSSGWSVDRALVLAIARQESGFNPRAKSPAGATGLMQLMPGTARAMGASGKLTDPSVNLEIGQRYVRHLLDDDSIKGNLLFFAASYNCGPANLARWMQTIHHNGDALLFLESIPMRETRAFVERVLTNFWAYRNQLGQGSPSLDAITSGDWPMYDGADAKVQMVSHVRN
jgi:soluble lytic murein transglycosylase-like protein